MAKLLESLSDDLAETVAQAGPALVRVDGRSRLPASGVVWSADGIIVTTHHVLERDDNIDVGFADGETKAAALAGRDPTTDLAVLRIEGGGLPAPTWAEPDSLRVGHLVLGLGRPGKTVRATLGIVSALGDDWRTPAGGKVDRYLQTDLVMYPGFSGGALVDASGRVLGVNTSALMRGSTMTLPLPTVRRVVEAILAHGRVRRGYLGVGAHPVRLPEALAKQLGQETGLLLSSVEAGSPADQGGLLLGDVIVAAGGQPTGSMAELQAFLTGDRAGSAAPVKIVRGGNLVEQTVAVGER